MKHGTAPILSWEEAMRLSHGAVMPGDERDGIEADMVVLGRLDAGWPIDIKYTSADNYAGVAMYDEAVAVLREPVAETLRAVQESLEKQRLLLMAWDAYRSWRVTWMMWHTAPPEARRRFVADPLRGSVHKRGGAVDVGLMSLRTGKLLEMPGRFDEFSERSACDYVGGTVEQRANHDTLIEAMSTQGFTVDHSEWWHFNFREGRRYRLCNELLSTLVKASAAER